MHETSCLRIATIAGALLFAAASCSSSTPAKTSSGDDETAEGEVGGSADDSSESTGGSKSIGGKSGGSGGSAGGSSATGGSNKGGAANRGGASGGGNDAGSASGLPVPATSGVDKPSGTEANLKVLDWAGFKAAASYTFDDTQPSQIEHYSEIQAKGIRATFYAITNYASWAADYASTWTQAVKDGHELGNHTVSHCKSDLTCDSAGTVALASVDEEIDQCGKYIEDTLGQSGVWTFAYPYGDTGYKSAVADRFLLARDVASGMISPNGSTDPLLLPVVAAKGGEEASAFSNQLDTAEKAGSWVIFLFHSILPTSNNWYAGVDISSVTESIDHGKELGDMWLDSLVNVGSYWLGQKLLTGVSPSTDGDDTTWTWTLPEHFPPGKYLRVTVDGGSLKQEGKELTWDNHGYYEVALDPGSLTWSP